MNHIIEFFESLRFNKVLSQLEFFDEYEQVNITKGSNAYLFYFTKSSALFRTNPCSEIMLISESNADLKLDFNNSLAQYLEFKLHNKSVENLVKSNPLDIPADFLSQFQEKLMSYKSFNCSYLTLKINNQCPERKIDIKKVKI